MSFDPPPPFDPSTSYTEWYDMINSIVGFVTASTQLATTLRNSRRCFPETVEITEISGDVKTASKELFNITDFPWFLQELINIQEVNIPQLPQKCHITEVLPLIQFPLVDIMQGEPNNEPRTITLMDTKDFGDVDTSSFSGYQSHTPTSLYSVSSSFRRPDSLKSDPSEQSCFLEQYTDSEQTIDSTNLQENFEKAEKEVSQKDISTDKLLSNSCNTETRSSINSESENLKTPNNAINKASTTYDVSNDQVLITEELVLECNVEEILIVPRKPPEFNNTVENKEECVATNDYFFGKADFGDSYKGEQINGETNQEHFRETSAATCLHPKIPENKIEHFSEAKLVEKEIEKFHDSLGEIRKLVSSNGKSSFCAKLNMEQNMTDIAKENMVDGRLPKNEPPQADFTTINSNETKYPTESKKTSSSKNACKNTTKVGSLTGSDNNNHKSSFADKPKNLKRIKLDISTSKETENSDKNKTKPITKMNKKQVVPNENTKCRQPVAVKKLPLAKPDEKDDTTKQSKKKIGLTNTMKKYEHQELKGDIDYVSKNIVNCLNLAKKVKKEVPSSSKNQPKTQSRVHKESADVVRNVIPENESTSVGCSTLLRTQKPADRKSLSHEVVRTTKLANSEGQKTKIQGVGKGSTTKTSLGIDKVLTAPNLETANIFNHLEMKSCFKSGCKKKGGPRTCAFKDDLITFSKRPNTPTAVNESRILPPLSLIKDTTLKMSAAETLRRASELLREAEEKALRPTSAIKMQVISGEMRPTSSGNKKY